MEGKTYRVYLRCRNCRRPFYVEVSYGEEVCWAGLVACPVCGVKDRIGLYIDEFPTFGHTQISYNDYKRLKQEWDEEEDNW